MESKDAIYQMIPHRPPFLWVDKIITDEEKRIETEKTIPEDLDIFQGHYPEHPIMPGVLLCEAVFQSGALLIAGLLNGAREKRDGVPVLTRIQEAKFKREVQPGDVIRMQVKLVHTEGPAWFLKGKVLVHGKTAVQVKFACTLAQTKKPAARG